ncbi:hypothetical protein LJR039_004347 [Pseudorhodoferax sp. LjRoot39]|uniref:hypothetical protein n=1 Tax=Pseudorhodoferax sp. LjRoot39 TaxID=3342328 RepID=UPI003ECEBBEF
MTAAVEELRVMRTELRKAGRNIEAMVITRAIARLQRRIKWAGAATAQQQGATA